jgi:hypothetical protein
MSVSGDGLAGPVGETQQAANPLAGAGSPSLSIAEAARRGLTGENFDLDENLRRGDTSRGRGCHYAPPPHWTCATMPTIVAVI